MNKGLQPLNQAASVTGTSTVLAVTQYTLGGSVSTSSLTFADIDATNLKVTFTAPSSGNVLVRLEGYVTGAGSTGYSWNLRDAGGNVANTQRDVMFGASSPIVRVPSTIYMTGLTPGSSYTWKWGHGLSSGSGNCFFNVGTVVMVVTSA